MINMALNKAGSNSETNNGNGRTRLKPDFGPEGLPPRPLLLSPEIRLQVFTHRSYFARPTHIFEDLPDDPSPDNEILEHLGDSVLSLVVTGLIRDVFPYLRVGPSTKIRALVVGNPTLASISVEYRLPELLRMHPAQAITLRASTNIQADVFEAYVGGLYRDQGLDACRAWLHPLFRPYLLEAYRIVRVQHGLPPEPDPPTYVLLPPSIVPARPYGPDAVSPAPHSEASAPPWPHPPSRMASSVGHLSLFNQYLQQRSQTVEWVWVDSAGEGTKTTPIWVVRAMINNECLGRGRGSTKKAAKNEAAKEGLRTLGVYVSQPEAMAQ